MHTHIMVGSHDGNYDDDDDDGGGDGDGNGNGNDNGFINKHKGLPYTFNGVRKEKRGKKCATYMFTIPIVIYTPYYFVVVVRINESERKKNISVSMCICANVCSTCMYPCLCLCLCLYVHLPCVTYVLQNITGSKL